MYPGGRQKKKVNNNNKRAHGTYTLVVTKLQWLQADNCRVHMYMYIKCYKLMVYFGCFIKASFFVSSLDILPSSNYSHW